MTRSERDAIKQLVTDAWQIDRARQQREAEQIERANSACPYTGKPCDHLHIPLSTSPY